MKSGLNILIILVSTVGETDKVSGGYVDFVDTACVPLTAPQHTDIEES